MKYINPIEIMIVIAIVAIISAITFGNNTIRIIKHGNYEIITEYRMFYTNSYKKDNDFIKFIDHENKNISIPIFNVHRIVDTREETK